MTIRLEPEQALQHPRRAEILRQVTANPGLHLSELARRLGCRTSPVGHHITVMKRSGLVDSRKVDGFLRFYPIEVKA